VIPPIIVALAAGTLFGAGLAVSGMADPQRVRGFLDLFGAWDPTLAFVMGGAILPMAVAWRIQKRVTTPLAAEQYALPTSRTIDPRLMGGAALFGIGWGVAGLCPGPAIADLAIAPVPAALFVAGMFAGMTLHRLLPAARIPSPILANRKIDVIRSALIFVVAAYMLWQSAGAFFGTTIRV